MTKRTFVLLVCLLLVSTSGVASNPPHDPFVATAYVHRGKTASGIRTRHGIVAADPRVLPLGSRIRIHGAGGHSGEYLVADTGRAIKGRRLDIWMPDRQDALRFGRRTVFVERIS